MSVGPVGAPPPLALPHTSEALEVAPAQAAEPDAVSILAKSFLDLVVQANASGQVAGKMTEQMALGQSDDLHGTMIAGAKSGIEKRLAVNIKDKVIDAFYEIWRMSL
jgi:flagellar hook-basal body complex protein FliE